jgi:hypothetical protein
MQHIFDFVVQVLSGAGFILGSGVLIYLAFAFVKTVFQEIETASDVALLLMKKCEHQVFGAISSVRRLWLALKEFKVKAVKAWRSPEVPPVSSHSG